MIDDRFLHWRGRIGAQRPRLSNQLLPQDIDSFDSAEDAIAWAEWLGLDLDDWQRWLVRYMLAEDPIGALVARTVLILIPRQNGKNTAIEVVELYGLYVVGLSCQVHSAHLADTAAKHMARLKYLIESNPELDEISRIYEANGKEKIVRYEDKTKKVIVGVIEFSTRTKSTKRGASPQRIVFDEALFLYDIQLQAMVPSLAAQSMDPETMPQLIFMSSAPLVESEVLLRLRKSCREEQPPRTFYAEWGAELKEVQERGIDDIELWLENNPGMGIRISIDFVMEAERLIMDQQSFMVERLGVVLGTADVRPSELPQWPDCADVESRLADDSEKYVAVSVAPDMSWTSIGLAGLRSDGLYHAELNVYLPGTSSAAKVLCLISEANDVPIWLDPRSMTACLLPELRELGVQVEEIGILDAMKACAFIKMAVKDKTIRQRPAIPLDTAVQQASVKKVGTDGVAWESRSATVDVSPLVAITLALWASVQGDEDEEIEVGIW